MFPIGLDFMAIWTVLIENLCPPGAEMLKPASAASIAGVKKLKVGVKFWATGIYFGGFPFLTVGFSFSQGVLNFYYV